MTDIRRLSAGEIPDLIDDLWEPFAREMADIDGYNDLADEIREPALAYRKNQLEDDGVATFVAEGDYRLVGYVVIGYKDSPPVFARGPAGHVEELYVRPGFRGRSVGRDLLDRAEAWARERGCERVSLGVHTSNEDAREFYESCGYDIRRHYMDRSLEATGGG